MFINHCPPGRPRPGGLTFSATMRVFALVYVLVYVVIEDDVAQDRWRGVWNEARPCPGTARSSFALLPHALLPQG